MRAKWIKRLKPFAQACGIESSEQLWMGLALKRYRQKVRSRPEYRDWLAKYETQWIGSHWGHEETNGEFNRAHLASQLFEITQMLRKRIEPLENRSVLDAGASDGMFLSLLGIKKGIGINILEACVQKIRSDGFEAVKGSVEQLPFEDKSFDYVICCETLEHVLNPVQALNELARVCRQKVFLTIPWLPRTRFNARPAGWPDVESHVFEFSEADFAKIVTFSNLRPIYHDRVQVFPEPLNPVLSQWFGIWMYPYYFPRLQYYELQPVEAVK